jgi:hypothetical protein
VSASSFGSRRAIAILAAASFAVLVVLLAYARPSDAREFDIGFADTLYGQEKGSDHELKLTESVNADIIRVNMYWSLVAPNQPANPRDPSDPAYNWGEFDRAISGASAHGFDVDLTVTAAPSWAEGPNRPSFEEAPPGSWRPDAAAFGDFAHAVAERYSGSFAANGTTLPAVKYFEAWNEPNLNTYISPQWDGNTNVASDIFESLLNNFYDEVKAVNPNAKIVSGGTAPYGDPPGGPNRTRPARFYRELLCLTEKLKKGTCPNGGVAPKFDIIAHHPINREDAPTEHADNVDDVEIADFSELTKELRKAEKYGTPATPGKHDIWANEVWWQTNPPDRDEGVSYKTHARWMEQGLYLLWKQGASNVSFLQFRDAKYTPGEFTLASYQTGVYTYDGKRKPSADAVAFPFVTDKKGKGHIAWGKAPASGKLTIEADEGKGYKKVASFNVKAGKVFQKPIRVDGKAKLRASVGKDKSVVWTQKG